MFFALALSPYHALAASVGVSATASAVSNSDNEFDGPHAQLSGTIAEAQAFSFCAPNCGQGENTAVARATVLGSNIVLDTSYSVQGFTVNGINFNIADAIALGSFTDVISFTNGRARQGNTSLRDNAYHLVVHDVIGGSFMNAATNASLALSVSFTQANGQIFRSQVGTFDWFGTGIDVTSADGRGGFFSNNGIFGVNLPVSNLQGLTFSVSAQMEDEFVYDTTDILSVNSTFFDPITFEIFDSQGNIVPDLVVQSQLGFQYSVLDGFNASQTPLPATLPLFATGLGGLGLLGWRRKRKAQAAAV